MKNLRYYWREVGSTLRKNFISNMVSIIGTGLILFILAMVLVGWKVGDRFITMMEAEAEISAYVTDANDENNIQLLVMKVRKIPGVKEARMVNQEQAEERMQDILGEDASILELFEENPFEAYIEIGIEIAHMEQVIEELKKIEGIDHVRDNREVLDQIKNLINGLKVLGVLIAMAVALTTVILISHMIRQGIYNNREQIQTLRLLGAPNAFIGFPFVVVGLIHTLIGATIAYLLIIYLLNSGYGEIGGTLTFLPLPPKSDLIYLIGITIFALSIILGFVGSYLGLKSIGKQES